MHIYDNVYIYKHQHVDTRAAQDFYIDTHIHEICCLSTQACLPYVCKHALVNVLSSAPHKMVTVY